MTVKFQKVFICSYEFIFKIRIFQLAEACYLFFYLITSRKKTWFLCIGRITCLRLHLSQQ